MSALRAVFLVAALVAALVASAARAETPAAAPADPSPPAAPTTPEPAAASPAPKTRPATSDKVELLDPRDPRAKDGVVVGARGIDPGWRDTRVNERNPNRYGQTGLVRINSARTGKAGYFDLSLGGGYFTSGDFIRPNVVDENSFFGGNLAFGFTPLDFLEVSLATQFATNANSSALPQTLFTIGDVIPSVKLGWHALPFALGVDVRATLPTQQDKIGLDAANFAVAATGLFTLDLYDHADVPLRFHANVGYVYQNARFTDAALTYLLPGVEGALLALTTQSWFYDQLAFGVGLEAPLPYVTPFLELTARTALGVQPGEGVGGGGYTTLLDGVLIVTPGVRGTVGRGLAFDLALDLGLTGTGGAFAPDLGQLVVGQPYNPLWTLQLGLSYTFDPFLAETQVELRETARPQGQVAGCVVAEGDGGPVYDAVIEYAGTEGPRIVVDGKGCFLSPTLAVGPLTIHVTHPEHKAGSATIDVVADKTSRITVALVPAPRLGVFRGNITNADDQPVNAAVELLVGDAARARATASDGAFTMSAPPGRYQAVVRAPGYYQQGSTITVEPLGVTILNFSLKKLPTKRLSTLKGSKIEIATRIPFALGSARLLKAAEFVLDDVVDVILATPQFARVRIEGHTDGQGQAAQNDLLSQRRAEAVVEYLVARGVPAARLSAAGFGGARPVATNDTEEGRAINRRVEFVIVKPDEAAP